MNYIVYSYVNSELLINTILDHNEIYEIKYDDHKQKHYQKTIIIHYPNQSINRNRPCALTKHIIPKK